MYTIYSLPNAILPLIGGVLNDKLGYRCMTLVFMGLILLGQSVITLGLRFESFEAMIFGRFLFGLGGESINITVSTLIVTWFKGSEVSLAQSINLSMIRMASILNAFLTPRIASQSIYNAFIFGVCVCLFSMASTIVVMIIDLKTNTATLEIAEKEGASDCSFCEYIAMIFKKIGKSSKKLSKPFWAMTALMVSLYVSVISFNTFSSSILADLWLPKTNSVQRN